MSDSEKSNNQEWPGGMMSDTAVFDALSNDDAFALLNAATRQYEDYLAIAGGLNGLSENIFSDKEGVARPDWSYPLGFVVTSF